MILRRSALLLSATALFALAPLTVYAQADDSSDAPAAADPGPVKDAPKDAPKKETKSAVPTESESDTYEQLNLFGDVFERVKAQYVEPVTDEKLIKNAINGMLTSLDPHSSYMDEKEFADMQIQTRGEFGGLGIEVTMDEGLIKVVSPIDDTPAFRAGVKSGDYITHLDGAPIIGMTLNEAVDKMRGKVGTPIELTIHREGVTEPIKLTINRDIIKIQSVKSDTFQDKVGYIRITSFSQNTDSGLKKAIDDIHKKLGDKLQGYVVDLRNNPGGLLDQAIAVSDEFLDQGEIVSTRGRHDEDTKRDNATSGDATNGLPIVVLINGGSASAAEIVSGALQDHHRAVLMGTKSFGKGSVQTVIPIPGHGAMRLTTARYYTPSGRSIQAKGIEPDIIVEPSKVETLAAGERLSEADLPGALDKAKQTQAKVEDKTDGKVATTVTTTTTTVATVKPTDAKDAKDAKGAPAKDDKTKVTDEKKRLQDDYQLARAVDLINGVRLYEQRQK